MCSRRRATIAGSFTRCSTGMWIAAASSPPSFDSSRTTHPTFTTSASRLATTSTRRSYSVVASAKSRSVPSSNLSRSSRFWIRSRPSTITGGNLAWTTTSRRRDRGVHQFDAASETEDGARPVRGRLVDGGVGLGQDQRLTAGGPGQAVDPAALPAVVTETQEQQHAGGEGQVPDMDVPALLGPLVFGVMHQLRLGVGQQVAAGLVGRARGPVGHSRVQGARDGPALRFNVLPASVVARSQIELGMRWQSAITSSNARTIQSSSAWVMHRGGSSLMPYISWPG